MLICCKAREQGLVRFFTRRVQHDTTTPKYPPQKPFMRRVVGAPNSCASGNPWFKRVELI